MDSIYNTNVNALVSKASIKSLCEFETIPSDMLRDFKLSCHYAGRYFTCDFLFDKEDGNVTGDDELAARNQLQKRRFAKTVAADETVSSAVG